MFIYGGICVSKVRYVTCFIKGYYEVKSLLLEMFCHWSADQHTSLHHHSNDRWPCGHPCDICTL